VPGMLKGKVDIVLESQKDVDTSATRRHFARTFRKYSAPIYALNLTKANNKREEVVAAEYRNFVRIVMNKELPENIVNFIHYDIKAAKVNEGKSFPRVLFNYISKMSSEIKFFSCLPTQKKFIRFHKRKPHFISI
jgi:hypothetical protein